LTVRENFFYGLGVNVFGVDGDGELDSHLGKERKEERKFDWKGEKGRKGSKGGREAKRWLRRVR